MKVLHLIHTLARGGIENWLLSMLGELPRRQYVIDFCCKGVDKGPLCTVAEEKGAAVHLCSLRPTQVGFLRKLERILRSGSYDIVHSHYDVYSGLPVWVGRKLNVPVVVSYHCTVFPPTARWMTIPGMRQLRAAYGFFSIRYALEHARFVAGSSRGILETLKRYNPKAESKFRVLYIGVDLPEPSTPQERAEFRQSFGWNPDAPIILHVGRFHEQKNHDGLLKVFRLVRNHISDVKLVLVGEGALRAQVNKQIEEAGLSGSVRLLGLRDDVPSLMTLCDLFLFPSRYEGFGLVALEANAAALPVVGSRIPGLTEAVEDKRTALLHNLDDLEGMAESVVRILTDPELAKNLSLRGRTRAEKHFSRRASARRLMTLYNECLDGDPRVSM